MGSSSVYQPRCQFPGTSFWQHPGSLKGSASWEEAAGKGGQEECPLGGGQAGAVGESELCRKPRRTSNQSLLSHILQYTWGNRGPEREKLLLRVPPSVSASCPPACSGPGPSPGLPLLYALCPSPSTCVLAPTSPLLRPSPSSLPPLLPLPSDTPTPFSASRPNSVLVVTTHPPFA